MALRDTHFFGVAIAPHPALRSSQCVDDHATTSTAGAHHANRTSTTADAKPPHHLDEPARDEVHRDRQRRPGDTEVEIACHREVVGQLGPLEVTHARRTDARDHQAVVQPGRGTATDVRTHRLVERVSTWNDTNTIRSRRRERQRERVTVRQPRRSGFPTRSRTARATGRETRG